ncbi:pyridoxal phosphate-dependent aminotransferase [Candidatus Bathyarchaeota archaeon]|nr:MAG: pyridoxal phosphate-dependent aminotransferase [Candidatus Bathyarchaeota archaeon]
MLCGVFMKVAKRMKRIKPSGTIAMAERARELERKGRRVYHLDMGEPDFATPKHIREVAVKAIEEGFTHYTSSRGLLELREAISEDLKGRGIDADPENEILVTLGAKHAIYAAALSTLDPGDEVLVLSPTWPTHFQCVEIAEAEAIEIPCGDDYRLDEESLKMAVTDKTSMILTASPNNPTGGVLSRGEVKAIVDIAADNDLLILSDEIYDRIVYDGVKPVSPASFAEGRERTIIVNGFSKAYAMTGWRLGYAVANREIIESMNRIQQSTTTCPVSFVQKAGIAALRSSQSCVEEMVREYDRRRRFIVDRINKIEGIRCVKPKGAFYIFPDISSLEIPSFEFCMRLLEEAGVSTTPGSVFGRCGEGHIRISYANKIEVIAESVERIKEFVENIRR